MEGVQPMDLSRGEIVDSSEHSTLPLERICSAASSSLACVTKVHLRVSSAVCDTWKAFTRRICPIEVIIFDDG